MKRANELARKLQPQQAASNPYEVNYAGNAEIQRFPP